MVMGRSRYRIDGDGGRKHYQPPEGVISMTTARDIMTPGTACIGEDDDMLTAARRMAELGVGSMPICGSDNRLKGMLTDRDIVIKVLADGRDPSRVTAG